jgi:hypothetical protein|tara:strand:- start:2503 stop:2892 length:390 start_codon:yes stop_codon:yes gene_type:complete
MAPEDMMEMDLEEIEAPEEEVSEGLEGLEEEESVDFASPTEALAAALEEHGTDAAALMEWFGQYGYDLVEAEGGGEEELDYEEDFEEGPEEDFGEGLEEDAPEEEGGPTMGFDIVAMRKRAAKNALAGA